MNWKISGCFLLLCVLWACKLDPKDEKQPVVQTAAEKIIADPSYLIEVEELLEINQEPNVTLIDFRRKKVYNQQHIKGALNIWRTDIEDDSYPYNGMMATKEGMEKLLSSLGISNDDILVVYDDRGCDAARFWWVLQNYGFNTVKMLDGGISEWMEVGGIVTDVIPSVLPSEITLTNANTYTGIIDGPSVLSVINSEEKGIIIDTRSMDEYSGKRQKSGAFRAGHIPNSIHIDWEEALDKENGFKLKSVTALETLYGTLNAPKDQLIITYCHTGVRSAHTAFVLTEVLGYTNVKNYDGSWSDWSYHEDYPIEKDSITTLFK